MLDKVHMHMHMCVHTEVAARLTPSAPPQVLGLERRVSHLTKELETARKALQGSKRPSIARSDGSDRELDSPVGCRQFP